LIKVVLDANVLVSGLISPKGSPGQILEVWMDGQFQLCVAPQILDEIQRVLGYPRIQERLTREQISGLLERLGQDAEQVEGKLRSDVLTRDPSDKLYLVCAIEARVDYLVTENLDHFEEFKVIPPGASIISPRAFLDILESE
jgi:putative PIN family toxin of toxin-antitoxin system